MENENNLKKEKAPHHGENIKRFRGLRGWKQDQLAEKLGCSTRTLGDLEKKAVIDDKTLQQVADLLQVHIDILKKYTDECEVQINYNGENVSTSGYKSTYEIENDVLQITAVMKPLYEEINEKNLEIYKLKEKIKALEKKN